MRAPLKTQSQLKDLLTTYYHKLADKNVPVAWCTSVGPAELLRSFGFEVYFPENHGALIGARRQGAHYIPSATSVGYSSDICSYLTSDIGAFLSNETPLEVYGLSQIPTPDVLVYNTSQCREVKEWFSFYSEKFNAPIIGIDTPRNIDEPNRPLLDYLESSWQTLITQLETISGKTYDPDRFRQVVELSATACKLWQDFLESNCRQPSLHTFFDHIILMAPVVVMRGTQEAVDFYNQLMAEVNGLEGNGGNGVKEKYRFYWEGMPIWGKIKFLAQIFAKHGVSIVTSTYCHSWAFDFDATKALSSSVDAYARIFITRSERFKFNYITEVCRRFAVDAVIFHDAKTCPYNTNSRFGIPARLKAETDLPVMTFYGDLVDLRHFSEEEFSLRLEAFIEQID
ncbi:MAG: 2-hydroxyacyl-CoA dehydratase [bacterium]|nr:2-hydroxyacyl-CoA dehydratase [bacterium]